MKAYSTYTDQELVALLKQGDQRAFDQIFKKMYPGLCFFAGRFVDHKGAAEEIAQDALFKLWQRREDFENFSSVKAFLYISTKNACMDSIDSNKRKLNREHAWYADQDSLEGDVQARIIETEVVREISEAIAALPEQCRKIMKMSYQEGMSGKEIAEAMKITVSTVNNQKARGIILLRRALSIKGLATLVYLFPEHW